MAKCIIKIFSLCEMAKIMAKIKCEIVDIFFVKAYYYLARFKKTYLEAIDRVKKQLID